MIATKRSAADSPEKAKFSLTPRIADILKKRGVQVETKEKGPNGPRFDYAELRKNINKDKQGLVTELMNDKEVSAKYKDNVEGLNERLGIISEELDSGI